MSIPEQASPPSPPSPPKHLTQTIALAQRRVIAYPSKLRRPKEKAENQTVNFRKLKHRKQSYKIPLHHQFSSTILCRAYLTLSIACAAATSGSVSHAQPFNAPATSKSRHKLDVASPKLKWARSFLMTSVFAAEYLAVFRFHLGQSSPEIAGKGREEKEKEPLALDAKFFREKISLKIWLKAKFALAYASKKNIHLESSDFLRLAVMTHSKSLGKLAHSATLSKLIDSNSRIKLDTTDTTGAKQKFHVTSVQTSDAPQDNLHLQSNSLEHILQSEAYRQHWRFLSESFSTSPAGCRLKENKITAFATHQMSLTANGHRPDRLKTLAPLRGWQRDQVECLVMGLMSASAIKKDTEGFEPLWLLIALQQNRSATAKDEVILIATAIRYLEKNMYAESLRILLELQESVPAYRLPYEIVQRIFSIQQRGSGKVAIKGL